MKKILSFIFKVIGFLLGMFGVGTVGLIPLILAAVSLVATSLIIAIPVAWIYSMIQAELVTVALPVIGYWLWFKILILIRLVFNTGTSLSPNNESSKEKEKEKTPKRTIIPPEYRHT